MKLEELQEHITKLYGLTQDPQPGLFTWGMILGQQIDSLFRAWYGIDENQMKEVNKFIEKMKDE